MTRPDPEGLEAAKQHDGSPGPVRDDESACRGAFWSMHYKPNGNIKPSVIKNDDLLAGELSVWRGGSPGSPEHVVAMTKIAEHGPTGHELREVFSPPAGEIRDIGIVGQVRVFYVIDDCRTDDKGGWDPLHAAVKLAAGLGIKSIEDPLYVQAKAQLLRVLQRHSHSVAAPAV